MAGMAKSVPAPLGSNQWRLNGTITDNAYGLTVDPLQCVQLTGTTRARDSGICNQAQGLADAIVDYGQNAELAAAAKLPDGKSSDQRLFGCKASGIGVCDPIARSSSGLTRRPRICSAFRQRRKGRAQTIQLIPRGLCFLQDLVWGHVPGLTESPNH